MTDKVTIMRCAKCKRSFSYVPSPDDKCEPGTKDQICDDCCKEIIAEGEEDAPATISVAKRSKLTGLMLAQSEKPSIKPLKSLEFAAGQLDEIATELRDVDGLPEDTKQFANTARNLSYDLYGHIRELRGSRSMREFLEAVCEKPE